MFKTWHLYQEVEGMVLDLCLCCENVIEKDSRSVIITELVAFHSMMYFLFQQDYQL